MESLLLDVPFVCKSWYKASRKPQCWEHLIFPKFITPDDIGEEDSPDRGFAERLAMTYQENLSVTASVKLILNRSCGHATIIKLPNYCTEEHWMEKLEMMRLGKFHMKEVLPEIGLHCNNFIWLSAPETYIGKDEASAIVTSLPQLKYLDLHGASFEKETLLMILQGCKQLVHLDIRDCWVFMVLMLRY
ncbi:hypothetical protein CK203_099485 [Vitis vinifera]|uniref:Uncharacterized protein n=1 Tax=Vitis vinifera TaxID=29760 RepID=A0A438D8N1_VITVI|nr:hypothetical protein CK203_099485 [Vitis vinifera]